ncbi:MAG: hypothetical protein MJZ34_14460 [Paludibacteraceae bacterium]|nr:hypothetical protein [Paludibacteraceae bacterium]
MNKEKYLQTCRDNLCASFPDDCASDLENLIDETSTFRQEFVLPEPWQMYDNKTREVIRPSKNRVHYHDVILSHPDGIFIHLLDNGEMNFIRFMVSTNHCMQKSYSVKNRMWTTELLNGLPDIYHKALELYNEGNIAASEQSKIVEQQYLNLTHRLLELINKDLWQVVNIGNWSGNYVSRNNKPHFLLGFCYRDKTVLNKDIGTTQFNIEFSLNPSQEEISEKLKQLDLCHRINQNKNLFYISTNRYFK